MFELGGSTLKLIDAINGIDSIKPNTYSQQEKIRWISILDGNIKKEIIDTHEGAENVTFNGYDNNTDISTELLVPAPYDDIYIRWLEMQIDYANADLVKYQNSMTLYNNAYSNFEKYYNRNNMPKGKKFKFF